MEELVTIFKALADETRLRILKLLDDRELCVCDLVEALNTIQPRISFHLAVLKEAGLILDRKEGRWCHYRLDDSDRFRSDMLAAACRRIPASAMAEDRRRLSAFLKRKEGRSAPGSRPRTRACEVTR